MEDQPEDNASPWAFAAILVGFKVWTLILILAFTGSWGAFWFLVSSHVLWITGGAIVLWGPALFGTRLLRVRARRRELQRAEWEVEDTRPSYR
ncbi:MAG TPA: hypothetical protein VMU89_24730 [Thermomicrobiaceae bacterium]|nr:hypothetical protein [Thermomicrobiaceae bacterium]